MSAVLNIAAQLEALVAAEESPAQPIDFDHPPQGNLIRDNAVWCWAIKGRIWQRYTNVGFVLNPSEYSHWAPPSEKPPPPIR